MTNAEKKKEFIEKLAHFLADNQGGKSVLLQLEYQRMSSDPRPCLAKEWATLRSMFPVPGWSTYEETLKNLTDFLT